MREREYSLTEIIRDPRMRVYEASELTPEGHYYLYRYDAGSGEFSRATVPSGAAEPRFAILGARDHVPVGGWLAAEGGSIRRRPLHLVAG
jgi:hypothetical protein